MRQDPVDVFCTLKKVVSAWLVLFNWRILQKQKTNLMKKLLFILSVILVFSNCSGPASVDIKPKVFKSVFDISVQNDDSFDWRDVVVAINSDYEYKVTTMSPGQKITISFSEFTLSDGTRFKINDKKIQSITVSCKVRENELGFAYLTLEQWLFVYQNLFHIFVTLTQSQWGFGIRL